VGRSRSAVRPSRGFSCHRSRSRDETMPAAVRSRSARRSTWTAEDRRTGAPRRSARRLVRGHGPPGMISAGTGHQARMVSISAANARDAATSSGSLRSSSASARSRARRWARSASKIAARAASERDCPSRVRYLRACSTSESVRIVSEDTLRTVLHTAGKDDLIASSETMGSSWIPMSARATVLLLCAPAVVRLPDGDR
jgi:hypothetical protein